MIKSNVKFIYLHSRERSQNVLLESLCVGRPDECAVGSALCRAGQQITRGDWDINSWSPLNGKFYLVFSPLSMFCFASESDSLSLAIFHSLPLDTETEHLLANMRQESNEIQPRNCVFVLVSGSKTAEKMDFQVVFLRLMSRKSQHSCEEKIFAFFLLRCSLETLRRAEFFLTTQKTSKKHTFCVASR